MHGAEVSGRPQLLQENLHRAACQLWDVLIDSCQGDVGRGGKVRAVESCDSNVIRHP